jgi:hypothetical protein
MRGGGIRLRVGKLGLLGKTAAAVLIGFEERIAKIESMAMFSFSSADDCAVTGSLSLRCNPTTFGDIFIVDSNFTIDFSGDILGISSESL